PIAGAERRAHMRDVTKRPQALVRESAVIAGLFFSGEPDTANLVVRMIGGHADAIVSIDGVAVSRSASVSDPHAGTCTHHGLECRDEAACRTLDANPLLGLDVNVRLAIGN